MLTEAIHSLVDSIDQVLLVIATARGRKPRASQLSPSGWRRISGPLSSPSWSCLAGGVVSIYEGVHRFGVPGPMLSPGLSLGVLGVAAVFEGSSFAVGYREYRRIVRGRNTPLWTFIRRSKNPGLYATLLEDLSALIGIGLAALAVIASSVFGARWADGAGLIGPYPRGRSGGASRPSQPGARAARHHRVMAVHEIATLHLGPHGAHDELHPGHASTGASSRLTGYYARPEIRRGPHHVCIRAAAREQWRGHCGYPASGGRVASRRYYGVNVRRPESRWTTNSTSATTNRTYAILVETAATPDAPARRR